MKVKLGDVCDKASSNIRQKDIIDGSGNYPIYGAAGKLGLVDFYQQDNSYIGVVKDGAGIGHTVLLPPKSSVIGTMQYLIPKENVLPEYLYYVVKHMHLEKFQTGATIPHIYFKDYKNVTFDLVPIERQKQIVEQFSKIERLLQVREQQLSNLDTLIKARFVEMFGDPVKNTKKFGLIKLSDLGLLERGKSKHRPRNDPALLGGPYPLIQTGEVTNSGVYIKDYSSTYSDLGLAQSHMWPKGTLCITIAANIAQTAILNFDACFPDSVVGFIPNDNSISTIYLHYWFTFFQKILDAQAPQVAQKNINLKILSNLKVIVPPLLLQQEFASFVHQVDKSKVVVKKISKFHNISQEMCVND